jgi:hypothetical protein
MEVRNLRLTPPNSVLVVLDTVSGVLPELPFGQRIAASSSCLVVGTRSSDDGPTIVDFAYDSELDELGDLELAWEGLLESASGVLSLVDIYWREIASLKVSNNPYVRLFVNDSAEPDRVVVLVAGDGTVG